jgi:hypothetical protein
MAGKASLCKYSWKGRTDKENNRAFNATRPCDHFKEFSAVCAVVTYAASMGMEALRLPRVLSELYPLSVECFSNATPWDLCHTLPPPVKDRTNVQGFGSFGKFYVTPRIAGGWGV